MRLAADDLVDLAIRACLQRLVEQIEGLELSLTAIGLETFLALGRLQPPRRDRDEHLVESRGAVAVEREPAEQHHARDRIGALREAGA